MRPRFEPQTNRDKRLEREQAAEIRRLLAPDNLADVADNTLVGAMRADPRIVNLLPGALGVDLLRRALALPVVISRRPVIREERAWA